MEVVRAVRRGRKFLAEKQAQDGSWRSNVYGAFKDGFSLTPLVASALGSGPARDRGVAWLTGRVRADGTIDPGKHGLSYPAYSSSGAVIVLSGTQEKAARDAWLRYLLERQLGESLGWAPGDVHYGGWGYSPRIPKKPPAGEGADALIESNLSATAFALEAVRAAGVTDPAVYARARVLVERCQNYGWPGADGGFFFVHDDEARNKAGMVVEKDGSRRFHSYGSMTADGLRSLAICGAAADDVRVGAARAWLEKNFAATSHPGTYREDREISRESLYYYWAMSVTKAFAETKSGPPGWRDAIAKALLKRQRADGSWLNASIAVREDDPLVATSFAIDALSCTTPT